MHTHGTVFSEGIICGLMKDMVKCIKELCLMGQPVKLDDLCIISAQVSSTPADDVESFELTRGDSGNISKVRLRFTATGDSTPAEVTSKAELKYTTLAERVKRGEITLSGSKGEYIAGGEG